MIFARGLALLAIGVTGGCAATRPTEARRAIEVIVAPPKSAPKATAPTDLDALAPAPAMSLPDDFACAWITNSWSGDLRFRAEDAPFARVQGGAAPLLLPRGSAEAGAVVEARAGGVTLRGIVRSDDVTLYPTHSIVVGEVIALGALADVRWKGGEKDALDLSWAVPREVAHESGETLRWTSACDAVGPTASPFDARASLGGKQGPSAWLRAGVTQIAARPNGKLVARLVQSEDTEVEVLARQGAATRIAQDLGGGTLVFGWVSSSRLGGSPPTLSMYGEAGVLGGLSGHRPDPRAVRCAGEIQIVAEQAIGPHRERRHVGAVLPNTPLRLLEMVGPFRSVMPKLDGVDVLPGARLLARAADLAGCGEAGP